MFKDLCDERCVNLSKMAAKIGVPYSTVMNHYNGGKISFDVARLYSVFFKVRLSQIQEGYPNISAEALVDVPAERVDVKQ